jgi:hypothetical protein
MWWAYCFARGGWQATLSTGGVTVFVPGQLLPYTAVYVDDAREDEVAPPLYRIRNFFPSQREVKPAPEDLRVDHDAVRRSLHRMR